MIRRLLSLAAAGAVVISACSTAPPAAPALTDPKDILTKSIATFKDVKTVHLKAELSGELKVDLMGTGNPGALNLQGTTGEGDVDLAGKKLHLGFAAPALLGVTGDIIVLGQDTYTKISLLSPKYQKTTATDTTNPAAAATDPTKLINDLQQFLDKPGVSPTKQADERCGDKDCYRVSLNLPPDEINSAAGGVLGTAAPTTTGTADVWVQKSDLRPAKVTINANAGDQGNVTVTVTLSNYDAAVTVNPPPDSEVEAPVAS